MTKPRTGIPGLNNSVVNTEAWGTATADRRYGRLPQTDMRPKDQSMPQFKQDQRGPDWLDNEPENSWIRGGKPAESRPGYFRSKR